MPSVRETFCDALDKINKVETPIELVVVLRHTNINEYADRLYTAGAVADFYKASIVQPFGTSTLEEAEEFARNFNYGRPIALVTHRYHLYRAYLTFASLYTSVPIVPIAVDPNGQRDNVYEIAKIKRYQRKGDILSYTSGIRQLRWHFSQ